MGGGGGGVSGGRVHLSLAQPAPGDRGRRGVAWRGVAWPGCAQEQQPQHGASSHRPALLR